MTTQMRAVRGYAKAPKKAEYSYQTWLNSVGSKIEVDTHAHIQTHTHMDGMVINNCNYLP